MFVCFCFFLLDWAEYVIYLVMKQNLIFSPCKKQFHSFHLNYTKVLLNKVNDFGLGRLFRCSLLVIRD